MTFSSGFQGLVLDAVAGRPSRCQLGAGDVCAGLLRRGAGAAVDREVFGWKQTAALAILLSPAAGRLLAVVPSEYGARISVSSPCQRQNAPAGCQRPLHGRPQEEPHTVRAWGLQAQPPWPLLCPQCHHLLRVHPCGSLVSASESLLQKGLPCLPRLKWPHSPRLSLSPLSYSALFS